MDYDLLYIFILFSSITLIGLVLMVFSDKLKQKL